MFPDSGFWTPGLIASRRGAVVKIGERANTEWRLASTSTVGKRNPYAQGMVLPMPSVGSTINFNHPVIGWLPDESILSAIRQMLACSTWRHQDESNR